MDTWQLLQLVVDVLRRSEVVEDGAHVRAAAAVGRGGGLALDSVIGLDGQASLVIWLNKIKAQLAWLYKLDVAISTIATAAAARTHLLLARHHSGVIVDRVVVLAVVLSCKRTVLAHDKRVLACDGVSG